MEKSSNEYNACITSIKIWKNPLVKRGSNSFYFYDPK